MTGRGNPPSGGGHNPAPTAPAATPAAAHEHTEHVMKAKTWPEFLKAALLDLAIYFGVPLAAKLMFPKRVSLEDTEVLNRAKEHFEKGEKEQAFHLLTRHPFGAGLSDEQMLDEDMETAVRLGKASQAEIEDHNRWLAGLPLRERSMYRNSVTLEPVPERRADMTGLYAKLNDAQRMQRLQATGKLDPTTPEQIQQGFFTAILQLTDPNTNGLRNLRDRFRNSNAANRARNGFFRWGFFRIH